MDGKRKSPLFSQKALAAGEGFERLSPCGRKREPGCQPGSPLSGQPPGMTNVRVRIRLFEPGKKKKPSVFTEGFLAAGEGFEPSQTESESVVLPLHNPAKLTSRSRPKLIISKNREKSRTFLKKVDLFFAKFCRRDFRRQNAQIYLSASNLVSSDIKVLISLNWR